ncbi:hybrid sensor histidine kinase/response regulator transcription factor [Bacteroides timonensis]|uniref:hybrid sensor histidine kinase/response regulator transcription factor n=1 Tax=Bacteroides timonensis TaxID=1470345 RepID=UPI0004B7E95B|nr:two-component regulator propeller domain-containing protein [Bacteroides timonensis]
MDIKTIKSIVITMLFLVAPSKSISQTGTYYSANEQLSSSLINQLYQDQRGFIWVSTEFGLNKFDGTHFTHYKHIDSDSTSLVNNHVRGVFEDSYQNLWIRCLGGLMLYHPETDDFELIKMKGKGNRGWHVTNIMELHNGEVWGVAANDTIFRMNLSSKTIEPIDKVNQKLRLISFNSIFEDDQKKLWLTSEVQGVACYDPASGEIQHFRYPDIPGNNISAIEEDDHGNLFIGTLTKGLCLYDRQKKKFTPVAYGNRQNLPIKNLAFIDGKLLIGTDGEGVKAYNPEIRQIEDYPINTSPFNLNTAKVHSILQDKDKNLWLGIFQKGIIFLPAHRERFGYIGHKLLHNNPIGTGCIMTIFKDTDNHLWIGADNEGVFELDSNHNLIKHYRPGNTSKSVSNTITSIFQDSNNDLWLGAYAKGLSIFNKKTGECNYIPELLHEKIMNIIEDNHRNLYIATLGSGLYTYNLDTKRLRQYNVPRSEGVSRQPNRPSNDWANILLCDCEGLIWIGSYQGVSCYNPEQNSFSKVQQMIPGGTGYSFLEDKEGNIWAGTSNGLYHIDRKTEEVQRYTMQDGLPNNIICAICEDHQQNIWVSTYNGISKLDRKSKRFINYYIGDGLQGNEFTHGACFQDKDGRIYFGGSDGITYFMPEQIIEQPRQNDVYITDFLVFNQPINKNTLSGNKPIVSTAVIDANIFRLNHQDNTFSIVFSTLRYDNPQQIKYQYRITELGKEWQSTETGNNRVTYNKLPHGKYTFQVCAVEHGNTSEVRTINIVITPPWYLSGWAYLAYFILFILLVLAIIGYIFNRIRQRQELIERKHQEEINEAKLQFFINISHEIRTPMTLIINPIEKLLSENKTPELNKTYLMIYRNSQRILRLVNQLMDIRKIDKGQMFMKFRETDIVGFINDLKLTFEYMARQKNIRLTFMHEVSLLKVWIDMNNFDKILMNLLSNAFKYTPDGGEIIVTLTQGSSDTDGPLKDYFEITIEDTGIGLEEDKIERIFDRFYQINNSSTYNNMGTGIGLHLTHSLVHLHHGTITAENRKDRKGSRFTVRIPLGSSHLKASELENPANFEEIPNSQPINEKPEFEAEEIPTDNVQTKSKTNFRILVVEDEKDIQNYLAEQLEDLYKIITCNNGKEAFGTILSTAPDLVISDVMMPEMDGITLCKKIKQNVNINHIPVILLTAKGKPEDYAEGIDTGADAYMVKPFNVEILRKTVSNLITNRKLLKNKFSGMQQQEEKLEVLNIKPADEILMEKVMKVINDNLAEPTLDVEMLAKSVGLSRVHLYRKLKALTNLSTRDFIRNIRIQQAAKLLLDKRMNISDIAYSVGFNNLAHFSNSFKEQFGISPKEYMQKYGNTP